MSELDTLESFVLVSEILVVSRQIVKRSKKITSCNEAEQQRKTLL